CLLGYEIPLTFTVPIRQNDYADAPRSYSLTTNMLQSFAEEHDTYLQLVAYYVTARLFSAAYCAFTGVLIPMVWGMMICMVALAVVPSALWIASIHVEMPARLGLIFTALFLDIFGQTGVVATFRYARFHTSKLSKKILNFFEFYPAINI